MSSTFVRLNTPRLLLWNGQTRLHLLQEACLSGMSPTVLHFPGFNAFSHSVSWDQQPMHRGSSILPWSRLQVVPANRSCHSWGSDRLTLFVPPQPHGFVCIVHHYDNCNVLLSFMQFARLVFLLDGAWGWIPWCQGRHYCVYTMWIHITPIAVSTPTCSCGGMMCTSGEHRTLTWERQCNLWLWEWQCKPLCFKIAVHPTNCNWALVSTWQEYQHWPLNKPSLSSTCQHYTFTDLSTQLKSIYSALQSN